MCKQQNVEEKSHQGINGHLERGTSSEDLALDLENIDRVIDEFVPQINSHPFTRLCQENRVSIKTLHELARIQFADATNWVPMLSFLKERCSDERLRRAIVDNIKCEAGCDGTPHTVLCQRFVESIGGSVSYGLPDSFSPLSIHPSVMMNGLSGMSEAEICGWLLATEWLVPPFFCAIRPAFAAVSGSDLRYLDEHISVDGDEHAVWLREAAENLLGRGASAAEIMAGAQIGGRTVVVILDAIYAVHCRTKDYPSSLVNN